MIPVSKSCIDVKILLDSISPGGHRLVTWQLRYHRFFHSELMTHRALSRNAASSRAIPAARFRDLVENNTAIPLFWGKNQKGMQATEEISPELGEAWWMEAVHWMVEHHKKGESLGLHKQVLNRVLEFAMPITIIMSTTDHANLFWLRNHKDAQPEFKAVVHEMWGHFVDSTPTFRAAGEWHAPLISDEPQDNLYVPGEFTLEDKLKISTGRCARVSYLTHAGKRDFSEDIRLHNDLANTATLGADPMHASPFEHVARAEEGDVRSGNFTGWFQYRKMFKHESGPDTSQRCIRCGLWTGGHTKNCPNRAHEYVI